MPELVQILALFLIMALAAFLAGVRLGRAGKPAPLPPEASTPPATEEKPSEPEPEKADEEKKEPEKPQDLLALAAEIEEFAGRCPTPAAVLASEPFQKALAALEALSLPADDLLAYLCHETELVATLAMRAKLPPKLDPPRLRSRLVEALQAGSLLVRTATVLSLEEHCEGPLIGTVVGRLDSDWENPASRELLEGFLRRRLAAGESLEIAKELESRDSYQLMLTNDVVKELPADLRDPLLEAVKKAESDAADMESFLRTFGSILPPIGNELEDGAPLVSTPGLEEAAERVAANLSRTDHPRPVLLTGHQGVGKSALAVLVAKRLQADGYLIFRAAATDLQSGQCYLGQLEERVRNFVEYLREHKILWIAESFQELGLAGRHKFSQSSILDMILPHLQSGAIRVLGAIRPAALDRLAQEVPRLDTALEIMRVAELPPADTLELAAEWITRHPGRHGCRPRSNSAALAEGLRLCDQFLHAHYRPGKLLELLKMAFSTLADRNPHGGDISLDPPAFLAAVASISGLPLEIIDDSRQLDLEALRAQFDQRVRGQPEAVDALVERVAMLKSGLTDPARPLGVFLFAGPTGTGKTEIAKTLAQFLFGSEERMLRFDMSEFQTPSSLSRLTGGPDDSNSLASRIRQQPFSLILLDEFEKADPQIWDLFLQVFDDGRLTDQQGNTADLRNAIIILTSNLGAAGAQSAPLGFTSSREPGYQPAEIRKAIDQTFRKEFVNRLDRIVCFQPLSRDTMREILLHQVRLVLQRRGLRRRPWTIEWDPSATEFLLDKGFSPTMGARPLQRAIEQHLLGPFAHAIVRNELQEDEQLLFVYARDGRLRWDSSLDPPPEADAGERGTDEANEIKPLSNRTLILQPSGSEDELRALALRQQELTQLLELEAYQERKQECLDALSTPGFWNDPARFRVLGLAEYIERIESSLRATGELLQRLLADSARHPSPERLRSIVARSAERLYLLENAYPEITEDGGWDAYLQIRPADQSEASADFAARLGEMYRAWALHRGMRLEPLHLHSSPEYPIVWAAAIEGFGAWTILRREIGHHLLSEGGRGEVAKVEVRVVPQPAEPVDALGLSLAQLAEREFAQSPPPLQTVRRYQEIPTPLVRDKIANWRTGRSDLVLQGHFDLIGC